ncbi:MAG: 30S ribosomal protein S15 [Candidatus Aenigmarchaeota archaeon]|nr:30S ribosomal protein S15 [Candidatus Aenigmarchaeota archaeon]
MSRMYSRRKGKSGSHKPAQLKASWVKYKPEEIEDIVVKLAKKGNQSAMIGLILRDQYGVPLTRINGVKVTGMLRKHGLAPAIPDDLFNLLKKAVNLHAHLGKNRTDYTSYRGLELTESKIRRLVAFHIRNKSLPAGWKYDIGQAKLLVK